MPLFVETDASELGFGAFLFNESTEPPFVRPVAYFSKKWRTPSERNAAASRRELKALQLTILHFAKILVGRPFHIITDNQVVLHHIQNAFKDPPRMPSDPVSNRALQAILYYPILSIRHRPTDEVFTSDSLSRSAWMELSPEKGDPTAWPALPVWTSLSRAAVDAVSRRLIRHFRHEPCDDVKEERVRKGLDGVFHSLDFCVKPFLSEHFPHLIPHLNNIIFHLRRNPRIVLSPEGE